MSLQSLKVLQDLEKTLREEFAESKKHNISSRQRKLTELELRQVEHERDDWKAKFDQAEQDRNSWKAKYEEQEIRVMELEIFRNTAEVQVCLLSEGFFANVGL